MPIKRMLSSIRTKSALLKTILLNFVVFSSSCLLYLIFTLTFDSLDAYDIQPPLITAFLLLSGPFAVTIALPFLYAKYIWLLSVLLLLSTLVGSYILVKVWERPKLTYKQKIAFYMIWLTITVFLVSYAYILINESLISA